MRLIARIEGANVFGSDPACALTHGSLTIGRAGECGWVLNDPDRALSKVHCRIDGSGGGYVLTDTSTNGVFIEGQRRPLGRGQSRPLSDGDLLLLGPYRIRIAIEQEAAPDAPVPAPALLRPLAETSMASLPSAGFGHGMIPSRPGWDAPPDPLALSATGLAPHGLFPGDPLQPVSSLAQQAERAPAISAMMRMPSAQQVLPVDWDDPEADPLAGTLGPARSGTAHSGPGNPLGDPLAPAFRPAPAITPASLHIEVVAAFLEGAGLQADALGGADPRRAFHDLGRMVRATVTGLRDLLGARKLAKAEFRIEATVVKAAGNSALKLSPDADRAVAAMLGQAPPGFLPGAEAVEQGFQDVKAHELAMMTTISLILNEIASQLDPASIRARVGEGGILPSSRKASCWDEYERVFAALRGTDPEPGQAPLLRHFAQAYAEQVRRTSGGAP